MYSKPAILMLTTYYTSIGQLYSNSLILILYKFIKKQKKTFFFLKKGNEWHINTGLYTFLLLQLVQSHNMERGLIWVI